VTPAAEGAITVAPRSVLVVGTRIAAVLPPDAPAPGDAGAVDATGMIVMPGLVNAHVHSHGVLTKWVVDAVPGEMWSPYVAAGRVGMTPDEARLAAQLVAIECLKAGVTAVLDHPVFDAPLLDAVAQGFVDSGLRAAIAPSVMDRPFHETIPDPGAAPPPELRRALYTGAPPAAADLVRLTARCIERWNGAAGRISVLVGPSAPQRCSAELLGGLARLATEARVGIHTHVLETRSQAVFARRVLGMPMTEFMERHDLLRPSLSIAHAVWVVDEDVRRLARAGVTVVHNPMTNLLMGSGVMPLLALRAGGVPIALGTDSPNSGAHHAIFESMRLATALPRAFEPDPSRWVTAEEVLAYATLGGARAVGQPGTIGAIEAGREADLVLLRRRTPELTPLNHAVRQLVLSEHGASVHTVLVAGQEVVRGGRLTRVDEDRALGDAGRAAERLVERNAALYDQARAQERFTRAAIAVGIGEIEPLWQRPSRPGDPDTARRP
jgi:cytosine/adenosine deaminase-related metal-dependent hydrolase